MQTVSTALCKRNFTAASGLLQTPNWPKTYPTNVSCEWFIKLPDANKVVEITCDEQPYGIAGTYPQCDKDHLTIFDGHSEEENDHFGPYCQFKRPGTVKTSTNLAKVVFHSGPSHSSSRKGFKCTFKSIERRTTISLRKPSGSFQSPNWPKTYPVNVDYQWTIVLPSVDKHIEFTFETPFGIAGTLPNCEKDYLMIYDDSIGHVYGPYCHLAVPDQIVVSSNEARVVFHAGPSHKRSRRGFKANYRSVDPSPLKTN